MQLSDILIVVVATQMCTFINIEMYALNGCIIQYYLIIKDRFKE